MATRVSSSTFVGRSLELAELEVALADAAEGRPWLAFVAGDSGVGKTRLLSELAARARASGARTLSGDCIALEALLWLLDRLGQDAPVLLAIEDLHWADRATRAFVVFLGRSLCRERVLVVASYRPDEMHRRHPLVIAVGQQLDDGLLSDVVGGGLGPLREALREAVANQILAVTSEGRYRFAPRSFEGGGPR